MNALEKILEEIEEYEKKKCSGGSLSAFESGINRGCLEAKNIIRSYMDEAENDGWIPCSERLPEEHDSMFAKVSDEANVTTIDLEEGTRKTETDYTLDGKWHIEINNRVVKKKVIAWQPLPKEYKGE